MSKSAAVLGDGISGLLVSLLLARSWQVTVYSPEEETSLDSPLICPEIVQNFLEEVDPGVIGALSLAGARLVSHREMADQKFRRTDVSVSPGRFLFLGRKLLLSRLKEDAEKAGVVFRKSRVQSLTEISADYIFDCTGSPAARKKWLNAPENHFTSGQAETMHLRFFTADVPVNLNLRSTTRVRGGVYPLEGRRFALSLIVPADHHDDPEVVAQDFIHVLGAPDVMKTSVPEGPWQKRTGIVNSYSYFYLFLQPEKVKNFYPIGDGLLFSNPIYGRGISLTVIQLLSLKDCLRDPEVTHEKIFRSLRTGFLRAKEKWEEVGRERKDPVSGLFRKYYLWLIEKDPVTYGYFLDFYQLRISPPKLLAGVLTAPLSLRLLIPAALALFAAAVFFLR